MTAANYHDSQSTMIVGSVVNSIFAIEKGFARMTLTGVASETFDNARKAILLLLCNYTLQSRRRQLHATRK